MARFLARNDLGSVTARPYPLRRSIPLSGAAGVPSGDVTKPRHVADGGPRAAGQSAPCSVSAPVTRSLGRTPPTPDPAAAPTAPRRSARCSRTTGPGRRRARPRPAVAASARAAGPLRSAVRPAPAGTDLACPNRAATTAATRSTQARSSLGPVRTGSARRRDAPLRAGGEQERMDRPDGPTCAARHRLRRPS